MITGRKRLRPGSSPALKLGEGAQTHDKRRRSGWVFAFQKHVYELHTILTNSATCLHYKLHDCLSSSAYARAKTPSPSSTERVITWCVPRCIPDSHPMHTPMHWLRLCTSGTIVQYEYMALAKKTSGSQEAMLLWFEPVHNIEIVPRRVCGHFLKLCWKSCCFSNIYP